MDLWQDFIIIIIYIVPNIQWIIGCHFLVAPNIDRS